jgi:Domain of unknown function (DUF4340)
MRGLRSTLLFVVVLGGLCGYIYFGIWKKSAAPDIDAKREKIFPALQADKIDDIRVKSASGETTTARKHDGGWQLTSPVEARADEGNLSAIASSLTSTTITRVVEDNASSLKDYGLAEPRIDIGFKTAGDKDYRHLFIGEKSPTGADLFAKRGDDKRVFLISAAEETVLNRSTFDLRDKTLLKFDRDKVDGVEVIAGGKPLQLAKEGNDWAIAKPVKARADYSSVEGLIARLQSLQMKSIAAADASPADLKKYGFDKPEATVNVNMGSARATLVVGGKGDDNTVYVRDASKPAVMTIDASAADDLKKGADEYRRKDIFEFRAFNATHLEITRNGQTVVLDKVKGSNDKTPDKWRRVSPKPADVTQDKMDGALSKLSNLRAASFVESTAKTGLDAPTLTFVVRFDDGKGVKEERVSFGKNGSDTYVSRPGEPGAAKVDTTDFEDIIKALDEISK